MDNINFSNWCELPTKFGKFKMYDANIDGLTLISFSELVNLEQSLLLRVHSSCSASEIFGSLDCDCSDQLNASMDLIAKNKNGVIIYLNQEGRGHGISKKIKAVRMMQEQSLDTVEAFEQLNLKQDIREYDSVVKLLKKLDISSVRLITNNPRKVDYLSDNDILVDKIISIEPIVRDENMDYLYSKNNKLDHQIQLSPKE